MEMVMSNGFAELSTDEMEEIDGGKSYVKYSKKNGFEISIDLGDIAKAYKWYKNTYVPDAIRFGESVYDAWH